MSLGTIHYLRLGVGWQKEGWVMKYFSPKKGGYLKLLVQKRGVLLSYYSGEKCDM